MGLIEKNWNYLELYDFEKNLKGYKNIKKMVFLLEM